jgi:asparagine synthase (glutamine-hydrolysing)
MCGIVGMTMPAGARQATLEAVRRMAGAIVHRGPDDEGVYAGERAVIGMRRLSIIDLSGGHQPIANEDETLWVVCNGEIYNFQSVRAGLERSGHRFRTGSDVEVLLHLYEEHGDRFLDHVSGMFAVALWDAKRERLILARDRLGIKPLYYTQVDGQLAFASEVKALLTLPSIHAGLNRIGLRDYLGLGYCVAPHTIFAGIDKLPPATMLIWTRSGVRTECYWSPPEQTDEKLSEGDWVELMRAEFGRAVREHMISDVPIGAFLSGGIDSSAVVAFMSEQSSAPVNTYAIGYDGGGAASYYNELSYASEVAKRFGTRHNEILVKPDVAALLPKLMWYLEEPISDSAIATTYLVSDLAAREVKVILSGVGGDELFAGYRRYLGDHYTRRFLRLPQWLRRQVVRPLAELLPSGRHNRWVDLARYARKFVRASELPWREQYREFMEIQARAQLAELLHDAAVGDDGFDLVATAESAQDPLLRLLRVDARTQLAEDLLLLTDKMTMSRSIECRVPFLDHKLVEAAARIPARFKLQHGELKHVLKRSLAGVLPPSILNRGKRGFGAPVGAWFKSELRPLRGMLLSQSAVEQRGLLKWPTVREIVRAHDANEADYTDLLLVLMNLEIWSRMFLDGESAADVGEALADRTLAA